MRPAHTAGMLPKIIPALLDVFARSKIFAWP
jgi:hypothetical protein